MPVFLERFVLAVLAALMVGVVVFNNLKFDWQQRSALAVSFVALAYFVGHTLHRAKAAPINTTPVVLTAPAAPTPASPAPQQSGPAQTSAPNSPAVTGNNNSFNYYSTPPKKDKPTVPRKSKP